MQYKNKCNSNKNLEASKANIKYNNTNIDIDSYIDNNTNNILDSDIDNEAENQICMDPNVSYPWI